MTDPLPKRTDGCLRSASSGSLSQRLAGSTVTGAERDTRNRHTNTSRPQTVTSLRNHPIRSATPHQHQRPLLSKITETPFSSRVPSPAPSQLRRNVKSASSSTEVPGLDWLSSTNSGNSEISIRIILELLIAPRSTIDQNTQSFVRDIATQHNNEVPSRHPRMWSQEVDDDKSSHHWEIILLEKSTDISKLGSSHKYRLKTPFFKLSECWLEGYQATWSYLHKYSKIQAINGPIPAFFIQVSTFERALDFKRTVQALIHFNDMWPTVFGYAGKDPEKTEPRISTGQSYISYHPDYWSANPATGVFHFRIGKKTTNVDKESVHWSEFVTMFVLAAVNSPSLAELQSHPVSHTGLRAFLLRPPLSYF